MEKQNEDSKTKKEKWNKAIFMLLFILVCIEVDEINVLYLR